MLSRLALLAALLLVALAAAGESSDLTNAERQRARERIEADRPSLVTLSAVELAGRTFTIRGSSSNPNAIAMFVENLKNDPLFTTPEVGSVIQTRTEPRMYEFDLKVSVR